MASQHADLEAELELGQRPFELRLTRAGHDLMPEWGRWHLFKPTAELDEAQPQPVRDFVEAAIRKTDDSRELQILEHPNHKRRWLQPKGKAAKEPFTDRIAVRDLVHEWLADRIEQAMIDLQTAKLRPYSVTEIAAALKNDDKFLVVCQYRTGDVAPNIEALCTEFVGEQAVPYLAAYRYTAAGQKKRADWEHTWDLQRQEDAGTLSEEQREQGIPVPPKYGSKDFQHPTYWRMRGKLDVPKERFILYPDTGTEDDPGPVLGWAGWDHLQQATALVELFRLRVDIARPARARPLLAGLLELLPWLLQWHNQPDPNFVGQRPGERYRAFIHGQARKYDLSVDDIRAFAPEPKRKPRKKSAPKQPRKPRKPRLTDDQLLAAVAAIGSETDLTTVTAHLGVGKSTVSKRVTALIKSGALVQTSARPKRFVLAQPTGEPQP